MASYGLRSTISFSLFSFSSSSRFVYQAIQLSFVLFFPKPCFPFSPCFPLSIQHSMAHCLWLQRFSPFISSLLFFFSISNQLFSLSFPQQKFLARSPSTACPLPLVYVSSSPFRLVRRNKTNWRHSSPGWTQFGHCLFRCRCY